MISAEHDQGVDASVGHWILAAQRRWPDGLAVRHNGVDTTFVSLAGSSTGVADRLVSSGLRPGDRVILDLPRGADALAAYFGVLLAGGVAVPLAEGLKPGQIDHIVSDSGARFTICGDRRVTSNQQRHGALVATGPAEMVARPPVDQRDGPTARDIAHLLYTSGSTGQPKGVVVTHGNVVAGMDAVVNYLGLRSTDRIAALLPFGFDYGLSQALCSVRSGATLVVERSPVPARIARTLREEQVSVVAGVPTLWQSLLRTASFSERPLRDLRVMTNSGAHLPVGAVRALRACQPEAELYLMYGLTEAFRSTYLPPSLVDTKPGSIGRAIPGAEILVLAPDGSECEPGVAGELVHRGPTVALGYWGDVHETDAVFRPLPVGCSGFDAEERVVFSGDQVVVDDDGDLTFLSRGAGRFKRRGHRFSPIEVTEVLLGSGQILDAAVDLVDGAGDDIEPSLVAHVVVAEGGSLDIVDEVLAQRLPTWMVPERVVVHDALATLPNGKHDLRSIRMAQP